jgi:hypothetical protein
MGWTEAETRDARRLWERDDGWASLSVRESAAGSWVVTLDRLVQAPEGELYRRETRATEAAALDLVADWRAEFDTE